MEDTEYKKLSVEDRCQHKLWKARVDGYEEAAKIFREIVDEKSPDWLKFMGLIKKMVVDSNALAQERGLEAALIFVENCGHAGKTVGDVMSGIVQKCIAAPKTKTKELAVQVALMYVEIEKHDAVVEELIKGMDHKNPKIVAACVATTTLALHDFGHKVVNVKPLIKKLAPLMSDRDKAVRDEGKQLAVEIYRWLGLAMKGHIAALPQVTIKELEDEFDKVKGEKAEPIRYLKSQQEKQQQLQAAAVGNGDEADDDDEGDQAGEDIDPMDLIEPADILSKMPKDFYDKLEEKKWTLRKESLDTLEKLLTDNPKLESGEYGVLVNTLKKVITKDTNVVLVAMAGKSLAMLAKGLGKRFSTYAMACIPSLLEKFKEKKSNVVTALREAIDAIYPATSLEAMQECIVESLNNKNPNVKSETASFMARAFSRTQPTAVNKKLLKLLITALIKTLNEPDPTVRDCSAEALGTLLKLMGEKAVGPFLADIDALKMAKIKECQEKAEIKVKVVGAKKERPATAPSAKPAASTAASSRATSSDAKPVSRPATAGAKKPAVKKAAGGGGGAASGIAKSGSSKALATERDMSIEEIQAKAEELLTTEILSGLSDANWKNRLAAVESVLGQCADFDAKTPGVSQVVIRTVCARKPGLKETNLQVLKVKLEIIRIAAETYTTTTTTVDHVVNDITEKFTESKVNSNVAEVLTALAEATKLEYVVGKVLGFALEHKSPKVQAESLTWLNKSILEFGFQLQPKAIIEDVRKAVQSTNPTVRGAAIVLLGTLSMYMGSTLMMFFENEKPALKSQIQTEFDKNVGEKPPRPVRGVKKGAPTAADVDDDAAAEDVHEQVNLHDLLPRVDISPQITESLLKEMTDKDWKNRAEGLNKLQLIISEAKLIKPTIGDLAQALALRLLDSNAKIAQTSLTICEQLATAMGPGCRQHVRILFPGFLHALGDSKSFVRAAALQCINSFGEKGGYKEFFESEMIADALKSGSPSLKCELWGWLAERLPQIPPKGVSKEELTTMVPHLYAHVIDRNAEVRKNANEAVLGVMIHLGYESMVKAADKQKPASKKDIIAALDKARPNLPVKPLPKGKQQAPIPDETKKVVRGGGGAGSGTSAGGDKKFGNNANNKNVSGSGGGDKTSAGSRKKDEDVDTSPLLAVNNSKNQRLIDEQKLRVLKWTFTQPREEFNDLLREQMTTANVNKGLMANMFHDDFRYHLKVIESLSEDLPNNAKALVCNLDLILKWLSLRFYDTNPSVLLKGLEYLNAAFQTLVDMEYILAENEGSAFIPHLLLKLGDPKDTVRNGVRTLLRQILLVYPYTKVFMYVMDGLKSKNARQRTECLDELGYLIESYGLSVCQPSQQVALKEIARHISDRDNSVRNAALNCVVQGYFLAGEKIYKLIGQLNEKDLSMLDERIKRAKKTKKPIETTLVAPPVAAPTKACTTIMQQDSIEIEDPALNGAEAADELPAPDEIPNSPISSQCKKRQAKHHGLGKDQPSTVLMRQATFDQPANGSSYLQQQLLLQQQQQQLKPSGPFGLNPETIAEIEKGWVRVDKMEQVSVPRVDISLLYEPIKILPTRDGIQYPQDKFEQLIARSRYMQQNHTTPPPPSAVSGMMGGGGVGSPYMSPQQQQQQFNAALYAQSNAANSPNLADVLPKHDPQLIKMIKGISSTDTLMARAAINELTDIIDSPEKQAVLRDYEDIFIQSVLAEVKNLSQLPLADSLVVYQPLLSILYSFFHSKTLGKSLSVACLKNLMAALLNLMADHKLNANDDSQYNKVINGICLKVLDKANFTNLNCALIRLLRETCPEAGLPKFTDLLMKCIWRNVKMLPERSNELNYDAVILEVHEFMVALPSAWWQTRPSDTPLRTVKTIIHNMAKIKGNAIMQHLNQIPIHSELHTYLIKILKNLQREGSLPSGSPQRSASQKDLSARRISNQTHETMSQIFKLISDKETKQQGLQKLYDFKKRNPEIDVSSFLKGASPSFQKYIEDGLAEIDRTGAGDSNMGSCSQPVQNGDNRLASSRSTYLTDLNYQNSTGNAATTTHAGDGVKMEPELWMDRLNHLRAQAKLAPHRNPDGSLMMSSHMMDNKVMDENLSIHSISSQKMSLIKQEKPELSPNRLQHIQAKLAALKKESHS